MNPQSAKFVLLVLRELLARTKDIYFHLINYTLTGLSYKFKQIYLKKAFAFEFQILLSSRPQQQSYAFVTNVSVDVEDIAERDADYIRLIPAWCAFLANNFAQLEDLLQYMGIRFAAA